MSVSLLAEAQVDRARSRPVRRCNCGGVVGPTGECSACRAKRLAREGSARRLDPSVRGAMERAFGVNFADVRVHSDALAAERSAALRARAFTVGHDIVFGAGMYTPHSRRGQSLLGHELAHVAQQRGSGGRIGQTLASEGSEREARIASSALDQGARVPRLSVQPIGIAKQDLDAGVPSDAGSQPGPARVRQTNCVIRLGGCANTRPAGIPTAEEIADYNVRCRVETSYSGPDVTPTDAECRNPPTEPTAMPGHAMICSKRLDAPVAGWFANHSYIDDTGRGDCLGASMVGNYAIQTLVSGNFLNGCAAKTDRSTDPGPYTPNRKPCYPRPGITDVHTCLRAAFTAYTDPSVYSNDPRNRPFGPNSNTFAATLARACCTDSTDTGLGWVPGWDHAAATPCPTGAPPAVTGGAGAPAEATATGMRQRST